ncbi:MAG: polysaccharide deacetylase family protein [Herminiimonas sp.]|nr:polysaccharide deacetylase family protein [Herminiimonas sp.]
MHSTEPSPMPAALCVAIHDVAPQTWPLCLRLIDAVRAVAPIPLTLLVVPHYHRLAVTHPASYERQLGARLAAGDELALHGLYHLDEAAPARCLRERLLRHVWTTGEGEFAVLRADEARWRISQGLDWFSQRGWPVTGFVAPAWLLGPGARTALADFPLTYTTTFKSFHLLQQQRLLRAPSLFYSARNPAGRWLSCRANALYARQHADNTQVPLLRLGLHPADARFPQLLRHCQDLLRQLLQHRVCMTKAAFAGQQTAAALYGRSPAHLQSFGIRSRDNAVARRQQQW